MESFPYFFVVLVFLASASIIGIYVTKNDALVTGFFTFLVMLDVFIAYLNFTPYPGIHLIQQLSALLCGVLAIIALLSYFFYKKNLSTAKFLASFALLCSLLQLFFF